MLFKKQSAMPASRIIGNVQRLPQRRVNNIVRDPNLASGCH
jgi:hypothetical protein